MAQAKVYAAVNRKPKGRLKAKSKIDKPSWQRRNEARADRQAAYAASAKAEAEAHQS